MDNQLYKEYKMLRQEKNELEFNNCRKDYIISSLDLFLKENNLLDKYSEFLKKQQNSEQILTNEPNNQTLEIWKKIME